MRTNTQSETRASAFTLIEVLIAMAIFAVALVVISQSYVNGYLAISAIRQEDSDRTERTLLQRIILSIEEREELEEGGTYQSIAGDSIRWEVEIEETEIVDLFLLRLRADPLLTQEEGEEKLLYAFRPNWSEAQERDSLLAEKKQNYLDRYDQNRP